ncbi:DNA-processing protein DprA [Cryobacterium tagatosivorans]|uniref:DNA-protecting protein DprA n=1 Tax=Cryobacterium tagatosivorans TaxID=1259199 RepID=A0A4R8UBN8_9MICO|nr:DNA-processing protein DprA [Cryobacterium tagatosivorans]TFB46450.1 DNA-protecting protein DprA [Cryobacterium tagatosivorans]
MTLFGLEESVILGLARSVHPAGDESAEDEAAEAAEAEPGAAAGAGPESAESAAGAGGADAAADLFARAAWTGIAEPGDGVVGLLVASLGASAALTAVLETWTPERLAATMREGGVVAEELEGELEQGLQRWRPRLSSADVIRSLQQAARVSARLLVPSDPLWPASLDDLGQHAPLALWWRGVPAAFHALPRAIALVGARAATGYGEHVAMDASAGLVDRGFAIVSGAAYGIDGMAHRAALASDGITLAFLAGGVDRHYPSGHDALISRIAEVGAVVSELPCGAAPTKWRFLQRNRLIAAAGAATVVVEAGWRSGSLNTAGHAAALGRPLGAVPGPVTSPTSAGCHRLIREFDAVCVTTAAEMDELAGEGPWALDRTLAEGAAGDDPRTSEEIRVLDALSPRSPRPVPEIARRAGMSTSAVLGALGALDLDGVVSERETGWVYASRPGSAGGSS